MLPAHFLFPPTQPSGHATWSVDTTTTCKSGSLIAVRLESESIAKSIPHLPHGESVHRPLLMVIATMQYLLVVIATISNWHAQEWPSDRTNVSLIRVLVQRLGVYFIIKPPGGRYYCTPGGPYPALAPFTPGTGVHHVIAT